MFRKTFLSSVALLWPKNITLKTVRSLVFTTNSDELSYKKCSVLRYLTKTQSVALYGIKAPLPQSGYDEFKSKVILQLNFKTAEDALPFYKLPIKTLNHVLKVTENDQRNGFCDNRLYYIASRIKSPSNIVSKQLSKRIFVYSLTFDWLKKSLDVLLEMGVSGDRILRDLWVLKYHHETIYKRLKKVQDMGMDTLYPWMVRCSEDILNRSIQLTQETKDILGETKNTQIYLANRLNTSIEAIEEMYSKMPPLRRIRAVKVKHFLDFLIAEGFTVEDITRKPRVLSASQKTIKLRLERLRNLGLTEINLNVLCRSRKDFKKFCDSVQAHFENSQQS